MQIEVKTLGAGTFDGKTEVESMKELYLVLDKYEKGHLRHEYLVITTSSGEDVFLNKSNIVSIRKKR